MRIYIYIWFQNHQLTTHYIYIIYMIPKPSTYNTLHVYLYIYMYVINYITYLMPRNSITQIPRYSQWLVLLQIGSWFPCLLVQIIIDLIGYLIVYLLVNQQLATEHGHRNSELSHWTMVIFHSHVNVCQRMTMVPSGKSTQSPFRMEQLTINIP